MSLKRYVLYFIFLNLLLFGMWEWLQTPFFIDITNNINMIVYFRAHCTIGDIMILSAAVLFVCLIKRDYRWLSRPSRKDYASVTILGVLYTGFSEILNVVIRESWAYSNYMPMIPGTHIGAIPIIQWLLLPSVGLWFTAKLIRLDMLEKN